MSNRIVPPRMVIESRPLPTETLAAAGRRMVRQVMLIILATCSTVLALLVLSNVPMLDRRGSAEAMTVATPAVRQIGVQVLVPDDTSHRAAKKSTRNARP